MCTRGALDDGFEMIVTHTYFVSLPRPHTCDGETDVYVMTRTHLDPGCVHLDPAPTIHLDPEVKCELTHFQTASHIDMTHRCESPTGQIRVMLSPSEPSSLVPPVPSLIGCGTYHYTLDI